MSERERASERCALADDALRMCDRRFDLQESTSHRLSVSFVAVPPRSPPSQRTAPSKQATLPSVNTSSEYSLTHTYDIEIDGRGALRRTDGHGPPCGGALAEAVVRTSIVFFLQISPNALARDWWRKVVIASTRDRWAPRGTRHTTCMRSSCSIAIEHELEYESVRSNRCPQQSSSGGQRDHG